MAHWGSGASKKRESRRVYFNTNLGSHHGGPELDSSTTTTIQQTTTTNKTITTTHYREESMIDSTLFLGVWQTLDLNLENESRTTKQQTMRYLTCKNYAYFGCLQPSLISLFYFLFSSNQITLLLLENRIHVVTPLQKSYC